jgi:hypothetical protein
MSESYFKQMAQDLLNIEVNTIVKMEMSGMKLPSSRRYALYELSRDYHLKLVELQVRDPVLWQFAGLNSFDEMRVRAKEGIRKFEGMVGNAAPDERVGLMAKIRMLERIEGQSSQIADIFRALERKERGDKVASGDSPRNRSESLRTASAGGMEKAPEDMSSIGWNNDIERKSMNGIPDLDLAPEQVGMIRKAWEIGTESIQLQTVIQIDGDVTTRISESFLKNANQTLLKIHNDSVAVSTGFWQSLVKTLGEIAGKAVSTVLGK